MSYRSLFFSALLFLCFKLLAVATTVTFPSEEALENALFPLTLEEAYRCMEASPAPVKFEFRHAENLQPNTDIPQRNVSVGNQLKNELHKTKLLSVYYPETPHVPHHLTLALHRQNIKGISDVTPEENRELFATIKKISEVYTTLDIRGFVIAQFDHPQRGHEDRYVVEIIPHLPGFHDIKNLVEKVDSFRYVLFRDANFSVPMLQPNREEVEFWKVALQSQHPPLTASEISYALPHQRKEAYHLEAAKLLHQNLVECFQDKGGVVDNYEFFEPAFPTEVPEEVKFVGIDSCVFCDQAIIDRQLVYEDETSYVLYNVRRGAKPGTNFLILPKRHAEKIYGLTPDEIESIYRLRGVLVEVLREMHPDCEVIVFTQDDPCCGQTVLHSHEQVVAVDPATIAFMWTFSTLYRRKLVSTDEMRQVCELFGEKIHDLVK